MAYLHQPIALNPITYSSGAFINTDASPTLSNSTTSPQTQMLSVYNREYGKDRGQLPLALVSSVTGGADLSAFGYDDDETEDGSSIPTVRDDDDNDNDNEDSNGNRMTGNVPLNPVVDVVLSGDGGGDGYGANVRSVAAYYRMPIESPTLPTVPISAVANGSNRTTSILPTAQVYKSSQVENVPSSSSINTAVVNRVETITSPTCYCCTHLIPTSMLKSKSYLTTACSHHYDITCLQHLLTHSLHTLTLPTCCGILIPTRSFLHLLPFDSPMRRAWLERELEMMAIPGERERVYCPGGGCGAFVGGVERGEGQHLNRSPRVMKCPRCERNICTRCQREAHQPTTTAAAILPNPTSCQASTNVDTAEDREFLRASSELGWQRCFQCRRVVQINEGCNHVLCVCGAEWCYKCGSAWRPRSCECGVFRHASS